MPNFRGRVRRFFGLSIEDSRDQAQELENYRQEQALRQQRELLEHRQRELLLEHRTQQIGSAQQDIANQQQALGNSFLHAQSYDWTSWNQTYATEPRRDDTEIRRLQEFQERYGYWSPYWDVVTPRGFTTTNLLEEYENTVRRRHNELEKPKVKKIKRNLPDWW